MLLHLQGVHVASYPAFPRLRFLSLLQYAIFHTVSDKNLRRGKAGYEASVHAHCKTDGPHTTYDIVAVIVESIQYITKALYSSTVDGSEM